MAVSWCDKLASTPAIGIFFEPHHASSASILDQIAPLLNQLGTAKEVGYQIEKSDPLAVLLIQDQGFQYGVEARRMFIDFKHRLKVKHVSGSHPVLDMLSTPSPYTQALTDMQQRIVRLYEMVDPKGLRSVSRIGMVSTTIVDRSDVPPGIEKFISFLESPWASGSESLNFTLMGKISDNDDSIDKCLHTVVELDNEPGMVNLRFDFQRTFKSVVPTKASKIEELLPRVAKSALSYFESLAIGDRFDLKPV